MTYYREVTPSTPSRNLKKDVVTHILDVMGDVVNDIEIGVDGQLPHPELLEARLTGAVRDYVNQLTEAEMLDVLDDDQLPLTEEEGPEECEGCGCLDCECEAEAEDSEWQSVEGVRFREV